MHLDGFGVTSATSVPPEPPSTPLVALARRPRAPAGRVLGCAAPVPARTWPGLPHQLGGELVGGESTVLAVVWAMVSSGGSPPFGATPGLDRD